MIMSHENTTRMMCIMTVWCTELQMLQLFNLIFFLLFLHVTTASITSLVGLHAQAHLAC